MPILGPNQYGKAENRVVKITRDGATHHIKDLNVSVSLSGDMAEVHLSGSNANVLPTDTTKNTVYAFAKEHGIESAEQFGIHLARHFVTSQPAIHRARIRIEEYSWERIEHGNEGAHSFVRKGQETRLAQITYDGSSWEVVSGLKDLTVMNSTDSEFWGYVKDKYTTLPEAHDRILATEVSARWRFDWADDERDMPDWEESYGQVKQHLLRAFAETYSLSLQQTLYQMGARIIDNRDEIDEVRFSLPNKHHFLVDLAPFGLKNDTADGAVYFAADRPYGLIEATVLRDGCEARIPADLTNL
ncbi:factor-independent urate hydroxylase [Streptomyces europaeiscabiei]|uniref:Uricase n=1 Tax=Streptomyces europaeiscabiei TaxID=146819 RepID=A0ABU4NA48_9ACTN|nr:urate oxidase [Streptomyces europaeiscabiei]MDX2523560.1 urate oxidase [Streptomyces europaeiscabiei]MDX2763628.1 urate oxidase [Streptomyces europaeiscabiei]MDX2771688.1 urate oxidase [Streptomyces europaeiscabiei]MDX3541907.1 urate oxidase [Streptomyces europaeiscabiei]MDX3550901.1 urate oxidase [Streptomyces europaeiscabiei]